MVASNNAVSCYKGKGLGLSVPAIGVSTYMSRLEQQQKEAVQFSASFVTSLFVYRLKTLIKIANRPLDLSAALVLCVIN